MPQFSFRREILTPGLRLFRQVLDDDDLLQAMRNRGYDRAKAFSWSNAADRYLEHYRALANGGAAPQPDDEKRQVETMAGPASRYEIDGASSG